MCGADRPNLRRFTCNEPSLCDDGYLFVVLGNLQHRLLCCRIVDLFRDAARLCRASPPVRRIIQQEWRWHVPSTQAMQPGSSIDEGSLAADGLAVALFGFLWVGAFFCSPSQAQIRLGNRNHDPVRGWISELPGNVERLSGQCSPPLWAV